MAIRAPDGAKNHLPLANANPQIPGLTAVGVSGVLFVHFHFIAFAQLLKAKLRGWGGGNWFFLSYII